MRENYVESSALPAVFRMHTHTTASLYSVCRVTSIVSSTVYGAPACIDILCIPLSCAAPADANECTADNGNCDHLCANTAGSYSCSCYSGYYLSSNRHHCHGTALFMCQYSSSAVCVLYVADQKCQSEYLLHIRNCNGVLTYYTLVIIGRTYKR